jgi:hypothetical protein
MLLLFLQMPFFFLAPLLLILSLFLIVVFMISFVAMLIYSPNVPPSPPLTGQCRIASHCSLQLDACHTRISELQVQLEKTRELLEDSAAKAKADRSERDLRLMQLEGEVDRAKSSAGNAA